MCLSALLFACPMRAQTRQPSQMDSDIQKLYSKDEHQRAVALKHLRTYGQAATPQLIGILRKSKTLTHPDFQPQ